jgi:glutamate/tyrosine decarboxylase-like PLP-dependent enzyme
MSLDLSGDDLGHVLDTVQQLTIRWLGELDERDIRPGVTGARSEELFGRPLPDAGEGRAALDALDAVLPASRAQNGRFLGYVLGSGEPVAAAADLLVAALNQNATAWRSGPAAITIEKTVVASLASAIGCAGFAGSLTGGGSAANLMGLAMAREAKQPANEDGVSALGTVYASSEVHMSIPKAVALLGIGRKQLRLVPVDDAFRMRLDALDSMIDDDIRAGVRPLAVVGTAGTVNTGAIDPLGGIADIAAAHGLWFHVDGAYGAPAAIAVPERFHGLDRADSLSLDAHKWLYQPIDCGCLLYRDRTREIARRSFSFTGDYAKSLTEEPVESFAFFDESIELSRRFRALKLWLSWKYHGLDGFRAAIRADLDHARALADQISAEPTLELLAPVELSAVCFRSTVADNPQLLQRVNAGGRVYLSNATIRGEFALRACFTNHRTTASDVHEVVATVVRASRQAEPRDA